MGRAGSILLYSACFVIVVAGIKISHTIMVPFLLSIFIAVLFGPPLAWLQRKKIPLTLGLVILLLGFGVVSVAFLTVLGTSLNQFIRAIPQYRERLMLMTEDLFVQLSSFGVAMPDKAMIREHFDPSVAISLAGNLLSEFGGVFANAFLIALAVVFILVEAATFPRKLSLAFGERHSFAPGLDQFKDGLMRYVALKTIMSLITGVLVYLVLVLVGVDFALLWATIAFLLNFIPNLGSIMAAIPAVLLAVVQLGMVPAVLVGIGYLIINVVIGSIIEPKYMGKGLGLSTLVVFFSLIFWGWVLGPVGMLLSVPLTMTLKIALESSQETRWIAVLLSDQS